MQDPLFVQRGCDVDGRLWPTRQRWARRRETGGLKLNAALTSPRRAGAPMGPVEVPAGRVINACTWDPAVPLRQRAAGRRSVVAVAAARSIVERVPGTTCGRRKRLSRPGGVAVNDALNLRAVGGASPGFAASDCDAAA